MKDVTDTGIDPLNYTFIQTSIKFGSFLYTTLSKRRYGIFSIAKQRFRGTNQIYINEVVDAENRENLTLKIFIESLCKFYWPCSSYRYARLHKCALRLCKQSEEGL